MALYPIGSSTKGQEYQQGDTREIRVIEGTWVAAPAGGSGIINEPGTLREMSPEYH